MTKKRRRLPVITTCRLCTYCNRPVEREMRWECFHGDTPRDSQVNPDEAPPDWCPLP